MEKEQGAQVGMNETPTRTDNDAGMTQDRSLDVLRADLARRRPNMPAEAQGHASNLIEQIKELQRGNEAVRPFMAQSVQRLGEMLNGTLR